MQPSSYQTDIIKAVQQRLKAKEKKGLIVEALAGCGKSTILWMIALELMQQGFQASEVVAVAFGKKNQTDLQAKFKDKVGLKWGESVRTIHSLCYEIYRDALGVEHKRVKLERGKYKEIAQKFGFLPVESEYRSTPGSLLEDELVFAEKDFLDLIEKLRLYCLDATPDNVGFLTDLYKLGIRDVATVAVDADLCLSQGLKDATGSQYRIDTTDMVWVPWALRSDDRFAGAIARWRSILRVLMCDEIQDVDLLQVEIFSLLIAPERSFLIGVGDSMQAVFFFRGAQNDGMERITDRFKGENLPLPICYRCGTLHLELVHEVFPNIAIQPRPNAPQGEIKVIWEKDFLSIFDNSALSYMGVCRKNAPLTIAAIKLLAAGKPAKIKDKNIGSRLVSRVREVCQRRRYNPDTFPQALRDYEALQRKRLKNFPDGESKISDLEDTLAAIWALFEAYEPSTLKAWENIVNRIFDESGYSPISLYSIHTGKGGEGQVSFILCPDELPLEHPKQVQQERQQEDHLLYVALTRTLADGAPGSGILYLVIREDDEDSEGEPKYPRWLPKKYRTLKGEDTALGGFADLKQVSGEVDTKPSNLDSVWEVDSEPLWFGEEVEPLVTLTNNCSDEAIEETATETLDSGMERKTGISAPLTETSPLEPVAAAANNCSPSQLNLEELEEKIRRGFNLTRDFYECGKSLVLVRDHALYEPEFATFEEYCEKRFGKSVRAAQYFMSAASVFDNLLEASCAIIPTAESQVRAIASLPAHQQVEIWQRAGRESKGVPTATKVREVKAAVLGKAPPVKPPVTPEPEILHPEKIERSQSPLWIFELENEPLPPCPKGCSNPYSSTTVSRLQSSTDIDEYWCSKCGFRFPAKPAILTRKQIASTIKRSLQSSSDWARLCTGMQYPPRAWNTHTEVRLSTQRGRLRLDLVAVIRWSMKLPKDLIGVEVKSCLADFEADEKWVDYLDFCHYFCFGIPASDSELLEAVKSGVPETVGILGIDLSSEPRPTDLSYPVQVMREPQRQKGQGVSLVYETLYERVLGWSGSDPGSDDSDIFDSQSSAVF